MNNRYYFSGNETNRFFPGWYNSEGQYDINTKVTDFYKEKNFAKQKKSVDITPAVRGSAKKIVEKTALSNYKTGVVHNVEEYLTAVNNCYGKLWVKGEDTAPQNYRPKLWFRGIKSENYPLIPTIARYTSNIENEKVLISKFKSLAPPYLGDPFSFSFTSASTIDSYWKLLFLMQISGAPTRLMEWSEDAFVALLFAADTSISETEAENNSAVWCLNPVKLNEVFKFQNSLPSYIPNAEETNVTSLFGQQEIPGSNKKPCALYSPLNSTRLTAQKSVFTVFPYSSDLTAFENLPDSASYLSKIVISKELRSDISEQLRRYGLTKAGLLPELESVAAKITEDSFST